MSDRYPVVSVVIPSYNHGHLIGRALESVFAQTYRSLEVIVVDNHSTDNTDAVLARHACADLKVLKVNNAGSIAYSRNRGILAARGDWIAFLDSDDWWMPQKLQECSHHFLHADLIYHRLILSSPSPRRSLPVCSPTWALKRPIQTHLLKSGNPIATSSVVVRRSMVIQIEGFNDKPELIAAEDYDAWIRLAGITERFLFIPDSLGFYHFGPGSASRKDMSLPMRAVYAAYSVQMSRNDRTCMDANAAYAAGSFAYQANRLGVALMELQKSFLYGRLELKIRSLILLVGLSGKYLLSLLFHRQDQ